MNLCLAAVAVATIQDGAGGGRWLTPLAAPALALIGELAQCPAADHARNSF
jgi:hypothetical protein